MSKHTLFFRFSAAFLLVAGSLSVISCSNYSSVPKTGFVAHHAKNTDSTVPFDVYWDNGDSATWNARVNGANGNRQLIALAPVDLNHMDAKPDSIVDCRELMQLASYFQKSVKTHFDQTSARNPHVAMVNPGTKGAYTLELAIISIRPTNTRMGLVVTALSAVKWGGLAKSAVKKGHIAIAARMRDEQGRVISELADYEEDHSSILGVDAKNFEKYGHHKHTLNEWAREMADVYSSPFDHKTRKRMMTISPFAS